MLALFLSTALFASVALPGMVVDAQSAPANASPVFGVALPLARANAALAARDLLIDTLRGQIARLRRMQFGASSEKLGREIGQLELAL